MQIRLGYEIAFQVPQPTPMVLMLNVRPERAMDLHAPDIIKCEPELPVFQYYDSFGNLCSRVFVPPGEIRFSTDTVINDPGVLDDYEPDAVQNAV